MNVIKLTTVSLSLGITYNHNGWSLCFLVFCFASSSGLAVPRKASLACGVRIDVLQVTGCHWGQQTFRCCWFQVSSMTLNMLSKLSSLWHFTWARHMDENLSVWFLPTCPSTIHLTHKPPYGAVALLLCPSYFLIFTDIWKYAVAGFFFSMGWTIHTVYIWHSFV